MGDSSKADTIVVAAPVYPRIVESDRGVVTIHHPQIESWEDFQSLTGWVPIEARLASSKTTWIGSAKISAKTDIDFDERLVVVYDIQVVDRKFADGEPPEPVKALVRNAISLEPRSVMLDVVLLALPDDFEIADSRSNQSELSFEPPKLIVSSQPASLMIINGEPVKVPIENTKLEYVVNTNWDLFYSSKKKRWYVLNGDTWQMADELAKPNWQTTKKLPGDFKKIPTTKDWEEVHKHLPAKHPAEEPNKLLVSREPAEMILIDGTPVVEFIGQTGIQHISNTKSDLFLYLNDYYYLVSGRWFTAKNLSGPWIAADPLPDAFANIPAGHARGHVLVSVPGTDEARVALIEAQIPRTATISAAAAEAVEVAYAGEPEFVPIEGTELTRAANTNNQVIYFDGYYYLCYNAVWFFSTNASGPWSLANNIPKAIYNIPASDPAHNVTYVYVVEEKDEPVQYSSTSSGVNTHVTFAYTSGYYGIYPYSTVVWGTGYYYNPWVYYPPYGYPYYWHYPYSYGYGAYYNPVTGTYGQRAVAYGPYGGVASGAAYNPRTGSYSRGWSAWDNNELARSGYGYNPRTNTLAAGNSYYDYGNDRGWREGYVQRGDRWAYAETELDGNRRTTDFETSRGLTGTSNRVVDGDSMTGSGNISRGDRSAQTTSRIDDQSAQLNVRGSEGGSLDINQDRGSSQRELSGTTASGQQFEGQSQRTQGGRQTKLEGEGGGQAAINRQGGNTSAVGKSAEGDLYAGRNGNVYRRTDDGWSQYNKGGWDNGDRNRTQSQRSASSDLWSTRSAQGSRDTSNLNRQYNARQTGSRNYSRSRANRSAGQMRSRGGGRRRR